MTPLFAYTFPEKKIVSKRRIRRTTSMLLFIEIAIKRFREERREREKNQGRLPVCSDTCWCKSPYVLWSILPRFSLHIYMHK